jgi:hypothetical protein
MLRVLQKQKESQYQKTYQYQPLPPKDATDFSKNNFFRRGVLASYGGTYL